MKNFKDFNALRAEIGCSELRSLLDYWLDIRGARGLPGRQDIRPEAIPRALLPHLGLVDALPDGRFRYRLIGTAMVAFYGRDYTGTVIEQGKARDYAAVLNRLYSLCVEEKAAVYSESCLLYRQKIARSMRRLLLPLSSDGGRADMILFSTRPGKLTVGRENDALSLSGDDVVAIDPDFEPLLAAA